MEHLVGDNGAMDDLKRQFIEAYESTVSGAEVQEPEDGYLQYKDWSAQQRSRLEVTEAQELDFWRETLGDLGPFPQYEIFHPEDGVTRAPIESHHSHWGEELLEAVNALAKTERMTRFMLFVHLIQTSLLVAARADHAVVHSAISNRRSFEEFSMIGWCAHGLPFRVSASDDTRLPEVLAASRKSTLKVFDHQDLPLTRIVRSLSPESHGSKRALRPARVYLRFNDKVSSSDEFFRLSDADGEKDAFPAQPGLTVSVDVFDHGVSIRLDFGEGRLDKRIADLIVQTMETVLLESHRESATTLGALRDIARGEQATA